LKVDVELRALNVAAMRIVIAAPVRRPTDETSGKARSVFSTARAILSDSGSDVPAASRR
jgi:hypothetical protein